MKNVPAKQVFHLYAEMSPYISQYLESKEYKKALIKLFDTFNLHFDEVKALNENINDVFLGLTHPNDFIAEVKKDMSTLSEEQLENLVQDVDKRIFGPVRQALVKHAERVQHGEYLIEEEGEESVEEITDAIYETPGPVEEVEEEPVREKEIVPETTPGEAPILGEGTDPETQIDETLEESQEAEPAPVSDAQVEEGPKETSFEQKTAPQEEGAVSETGKQGGFEEIQERLEQNTHTPKQEEQVVLVEESSSEESTNPDPYREPIE